MANPYFNAAYYLAQNEDLVIAGYTEATAEQHYNDHGAGEGRQPNPWFDAKAYLLANPDLSANGVTLATALQHFTDYGVHEGRVFNNNPALDPSNFPAALYASENEDVAARYGITDPETLTVEQERALLQHYLEYGIAEERKGAGEFGQAAQAPESIIPVESSNVVVGTAGDDTFTWNTEDTPVASVNGLAGNDTLAIENALADAVISATIASVENISIDAEENVHLTVTGSSVQKLTVDAADSTVTYIGRKVDSVVLTSGSVLLDYESGVSGSADALNVTWGKGAKELIVEGVEQLDVAVNQDAEELKIASNVVSGSNLTFNVTGGKEGGDVTAAFESSGSAKLSTVNIDAAAFDGNLTITGIGDLVNVNAVVVTGAGDDVITLETIKGKTATVNAGAGNDTLNGSIGTDDFTGGAGADSYVFTLATAALSLEDGEISGFDIIRDFKNHEDEDASLVESVTIGVAAAASDIVVGLGEIVDGKIVKFETGFLDGKDLTDVVAALDKYIADGVAVLFDFEGSAYLYSNADAVDSGLEGDALIQLAGVKSSALSFSGTNVVYTPDV